jgi:anti-sigma B factor antagonist
VPERGSFEIVTEDVGDGVRLVAVRGEADRFRAEAVSRAIRSAGEGDRHVIVDLSEATYMDSSMIATFVAASEQSRREAREVVLVVGTPRLRRALEIKGLVSILHVAGSRDQALELLRAAEAPSPGPPADPPISP